MMMLHSHSQQLFGRPTWCQAALKPVMGRGNKERHSAGIEPFRHIRRLDESTQSARI